MIVEGLASSCADGSNLATAGPKSAATTATSTIVAPTLLIPDPRIDEAVHQIGQEVHAHIGDRDQENATLEI